MSTVNYPKLEDTIGNTPLVQLQKIPGNTSNTLLAKLEGNNPAGSVKDRAALYMFKQAEARGEISPGDTLVEATSGNTGIALAMVAAIKGYHIKLVMPENMTEERKAAMQAYNAELILVTQEKGMEGARDLAKEIASKENDKLINQFANPDNPEAHYQTTAPEIWKTTQGKITHFISAMGTTGTIMGCSKFFKEKNPNIQIIGVQPEEGASIPGIRRWPKEYLPKIYDASRVDKIIDIDQHTAEQMTQRLASEEGICAGISSGGATAAALQVSQTTENAVIVTIICDRGDRYLSSGIFN